MWSSKWICQPRCRCQVPPNSDGKCPPSSESESGPRFPCKCLVFPPDQVFVHRNIAKYVFFFLSGIRPSPMGCSRPSFHVRAVQTTADCYFSVNSTSQTTMPSLFSHTVLLVSRVTPSKRFASSDTPIVVVSKPATTQSDPQSQRTLPSPQIQFFGLGSDPSENSLRST